jgi:hypothetical protein
MNRLKFLLAFIVAPLTPAVILVAPAMVSGVPLSSVNSMFVLVCVVTYAHALVLGCPVAWLISRFAALSLLRVVAAAFLIGAAPFGSFMLYQELTTPSGAGYTANGVVLKKDGHLTNAGIWNAVFGVLGLGGLGMTAGLVWWLIAKPKKQTQANT